MRFICFTQDNMHIRNGDIDVTFFNADHFNYYTDKQWPSYYDMNYEIDAGHYSYSNDGVTIKTLPHPNAEYEELIENAALYLERQKDPYYKLTEQAQKDFAFNKRANDIIKRRQLENSKDFTYNDNLYKSDEVNIQGVHLKIQSMDDADPIPTFIGTPFHGCWATATENFVYYTVADFKEFSDYYYDYREKNFTNYTMLTYQLRELYLNDGSKEQLLNFSIEDGWV